MISSDSGVVDRSYRQGDIVLIERASLPIGLVPARRDAAGRVVLSLSPQTGHAHVLHESAVTGFCAPPGESSGPFDYPGYLRVGPGGGTLSHELVTGELAEHRAVDIAEGVYEVAKQVEYRPVILSGAIDEIMLEEDDRQVSIADFGWERFKTIFNARTLDHDIDALGHERELIRFDAPELDDSDHAVFLVRITDAAPHPGLGFNRTYLRRIDPLAYGGQARSNCRAAVASTFHKRGNLGELAFSTPECYEPSVET